VISRHSLRYSKVLSFIMFLAVLSSCLGKESRSGQAPSGLQKFEKREIAIEGKNGKITIKAELARTQAQHQQGFMYRKTVKDGEGMLFIFDSDETRSFWMKNTLVPLSIAYIASDGRILEIYDMEPGNLNSVRSSRSVRYALEVPQGWFGRAGIDTGDRLILAGL